MKKIRLTNFSKIPLERVATLAIEDLLELAKEADETLLAAERLKNWINDAIILSRTKMNGESI